MNGAGKVILWVCVNFTDLPCLSRFRCCSIFLLGSCSIRQTITLEENLSGRWISDGTAQEFAGNTFNDLALLGGYNDAAELYDGALKNARTDLLNRTSVKTAEITLTGPHSWHADIQFNNLEELLGAAEGSGIVEITQNGDVSTFHFRFRPGAIQEY